MITTVLFATLGGLARLIDGASKEQLGFHVQTVLRGCVLIALSALVWHHVTTYPLMVAWGAFWCSMALIVGQTDWEDFLWQPTRFALFGFAASWWMSPATSWCIPLGMALAGLSYPVLFWLDSKWSLPRAGLLDGHEAYARFIAGAACIACPLIA